MAHFHQFERPRYFAGQLLTENDLQAEQDYFRGKARLHNRFMHGWGVISGLRVTVDQGTTLVVAPGLALDCAGNELVLTAPEHFSLSGLSGRRYLTIEYMELPVAQVPSPDGLRQYSRIRESVSLKLDDTNPGLGHARIGPGSPGCGLPHALRLATISQRGTNWRVSAARPIAPHRK